MINIRLSEDEYLAFSKRPGNLTTTLHVGRESLYKTLSGTKNPKWHTLVSLCVAMGFKLEACIKILEIKQASPFETGS